MQAGRAMFLNDELQRLFSDAPGFSGRFRRHIETAFAIVFMQTADGAWLAAYRTGFLFCRFHFIGQQLLCFLSCRTREETLKNYQSCLIPVVTFESPGAC